jgi:hypothetical protein
MYMALMLVVTIMMTFAIQHRRLADQILGLRPMNDATGPAVEELKNAPRVIRDEMSCWRSVERFHPSGVSGASCPKI